MKETWHPGKIKNEQFYDCKLLGSSKFHHLMLSSSLLSCSRNGLNLHCSPFEKFPQ